MTNPPDGDNRWTAVMSTDLVGFTELSQSIGPERVYALLMDVLSLAKEAIAAHGGHVVDTAGDGILAAFGAPTAVENASLSACRAALDFRDALHASRARLEQTYGTEPRFRTAIASGTVMVARQTDTEIKLVGVAVNKVARLQAQAAPDETLISYTIQREAEGFINTTKRGLLALKGFPDPVPVYALDNLVETSTRFDGAKQRGLGKLVGRASEREEILASLNDHPGTAILLRGPAGIGKSRLTDSIINAGSKTCFIGQCRPSGQATAYEPFLEVFRQAAGVNHGADRKTILAPLLERYPELKDASEAIRAEESAMDQTDRALSLRSLYEAILKRIAGDGATLIVLEDIHWIDPASAVLLHSALRSGLPLLLTTRPELETDQVDGGRLKVFDLTPLDEHAIETIAEASIGKTLTPAARDFVTRRAEGNPLFAEELSRALLQDDHLNISGEIADLEDSPDTLLTGQLEQLVLTRVDRLDPLQHDTIAHAAALGRDFDEEDLAEALGSSPELSEIAKTPGLIEATGPGRWRFVHALIGDAIYQSLLSERRKAIHLSLAGALENRPHSPPRIVAEHYLKSAHPEKAVPYLISAGGQSLAAYVLQDADAMLSRAYEMVSEAQELVDDDTYGELVVYWLRTMDCMGNFGRGVDLSGKLLPRLEARPYSPALGVARMLRTIALAHGYRYDEARQLAEMTLKEAEQQNDPWGAGWAKVALMRILDETRSADISAIERLSAEVEPIAEETGDTYMGLTARYLLCSAYRSVGARRNALAQAEKLEEFSVTHRDRRAMGHAKWARAMVHAIESSPEGTREAIKDADEYVIPGSGDERVTRGIFYFCEMFLSPPGTYDARITALQAEAERMRDFNIEQSMAFTNAIAAFHAGRLALGWRRLEEMETRTGHSGNMNMRLQVKAARIEALLAISGLVDPASEAPPDRPRFRRKPGLADVLKALTLRFRALSLAETEIAQSYELMGEGPHPHQARYEIAIGLIRLKQKNKAAASQHLKEGLRLAEAEGLELLARRARKGLASL